MTSGDSRVSVFLKKLNLLKYSTKFGEEGPLPIKDVGEFSRFLAEPDTLKRIGMTVFEINRFKRLCKDIIDVRSVIDLCLYDCIIPYLPKNVKSKVEYFLFIASTPMANSSSV